jgi:toxin ParE1/3/4
MAKYTLRPSARQDLEQIWFYTFQNWGEEQAEKYISELDERFQWLAGNPQLGKARRDIRTGIVSYPQGSHIIFYQQVEGDVDIIRILHKNMDIETHME